MSIKYKEPVQYGKNKVFDSFWTCDSDGLGKIVPSIIYFWTISDLFPVPDAAAEACSDPIVGNQHTLSIEHSPRKETNKRLAECAARAASYAA